jgi:hypothetical protein
MSEFIKYFHLYRFITEKGTSLQDLVNRTDNLPVVYRIVIPLEIIYQSELKHVVQQGDSIYNRTVV